MDDGDRSLSGEGVRVAVAVTHWVAMSVRHGGNRELMGKPCNGMIGGVGWMVVFVPGIEGRWGRVSVYVGWVMHRLCTCREVGFRMMPV